MQIEVIKRNETNSEFYEILNFKVISDNTDLLLVKYGKMSLSETSAEVGALLEIHKIQSLLLCNTEIGENLIVAFYIVEGFEPNACVIKGLPKKYHQSGDDFMVVDYRSYSQICELTSETKLSLTDYIQELKKGDSRVNTIFIHGDKCFNRDQQNELWKN